MVHLLGAKPFAGGGEKKEPLNQSVNTVDEGHGENERHNGVELVIVEVDGQDAMGRVGN